jgi:glutamate/tyrosine decarboxylase-like PLP-dependent enzyme
VRRSDELELLTQSLSITTFRYVPPELRPKIGEADAEQRFDTLNRALLDRLQREGEVFVSQAVVHGRFALRACIVNFHTTLADVEAAVAIAVRVGREIHAASRRA